MSNRFKKNIWRMKECVQSTCAFQKECRNQGASKMTRRGPMIRSLPLKRATTRLSWKRKCRSSTVSPSSSAPSSVPAFSSVQRESLNIPEAWMRVFSFGRRPEFILWYIIYPFLFFSETYFSMTFVLSICV